MIVYQFYDELNSYHNNYTCAVYLCQPWSLVLIQFFSTLLIHYLQNKAIVTINARTSEILTANDMAAELFSYSRKQLIGIKMSDLFADTHKEKQEALVEQHIEASGAVVMVSGKVVCEDIF